MSEASQRFHRYDPSIVYGEGPIPGRNIFGTSSPNWEHYLAQYRGNSENLAYTSVLNVAFTPLVYAFRNKMHTLHRGDFYMPSYLWGQEPKLRSYTPINFDAFTKIYNTISEKDCPAFQQFYVSEKNPDHPGSGPKVNHVLVPVGEYGPALALAALQAARATNACIHETMREECSKTNEEYEALMWNETYQNDQVIATLTDAVQTIAASYALLTAKKINGYEDNPLGIFLEVVRNKQLNLLAKESPLADIVPMSLNGVAYEETLEQTSAGNIHLSPRLLDFIRAEKAADRGKSIPQYRGEGCPAALENTPYMHHGQREVIRESGINLMAEVFYLYLDYFYRH